MNNGIALFIWLAGCTGAFFLGKTLSPPPETPQTKSSTQTTHSPFHPPVTPLRDPFLNQLQQLKSSDEFQTTFEQLSPNFQDSQTHDQLFLLADQWAALHPEEAARWLDQLAFDDVRNPFLFSALTQWARQAPEAAQSWVATNYPDANATRHYLLAALVRGLSQTDPDQALTLLLSSPSSPERSGALDYLLTAWAQESLSHAFKKIEQLPNTETKLRQRALQRLFADLLPSEIPQAQTLANNLRDPLEREKAFAALASTWAQHDIDAALQWASQLPQLSSRAQSLGTLGTQWARQNPTEANQWLADKQAPQYDFALRSVAGTLIASDPDTALAQISRITNPQLQSLSFEQLGRIWLNRDPQGFRTAMATDTLLPAEVRETLLQNFR